MPIDYSKYPANWHTEIRPRIMARAGEQRDIDGNIVKQACCEFCKVENRKTILRGEYDGKEVYQGMDGWIYDANTSEQIGGGYLGEVDPQNKNKCIEIVLTVAHLDHDPENENVNDAKLSALCQRCHLNYDRPHLTQKRTVRKYKNSLFPI